MPLMAAGMGDLPDPQSGVGVLVVSSRLHPGTSAVWSTRFEVTNRDSGKTYTINIPTSNQNKLYDLEPGHYNVTSTIRLNQEGDVEEREEGRQPDVAFDIREGEITLWPYVSYYYNPRSPGATHNNITRPEPVKSWHLYNGHYHTDGNGQDLVVVTYSVALNSILEEEIYTDLSSKGNFDLWKYESVFRKASFHLIGIGSSSLMTIPKQWGAQYYEGDLTEMQFDSRSFGSGAIEESISEQIGEWGKDDLVLIYINSALKKDIGSRHYLVSQTDGGNSFRTASSLRSVLLEFAAYKGTLIMIIEKRSAQSSGWELRKTEDLLDMEALEAIAGEMSGHIIMLLKDNSSSPEDDSFIEAVTKSIEAFAPYNIGSEEKWRKELPEEQSPFYFLSLP